MQAISLSTTWVQMQAVWAHINTMCPSWQIGWMICVKLSDNLLVLKLMTCSSNYYLYWNFSVWKDQKFILQQTDRKIIKYTTLKQTVGKHHDLWHGSIMEFFQNNWLKHQKLQFIYLVLLPWHKLGPSSKEALDFFKWIKLYIIQIKWDTGFTCQVHNISSSKYAFREISTLITT
jgi:hypothetical protein